MTIRRPRTSVVALAGDGDLDRTSVRALADSLGALGIEVVWAGRQTRPEHVAEIVSRHNAHAVEVCISGRGGVPFLRELLSELIRVGRRDVSIVIHRVALPVPLTG